MPINIRRSTALSRVVGVMQNRNGVEMPRAIRSFLRQQQAMATADFALIVAIIAAGAAAGISVWARIAGIY